MAIHKRLLISQSSHVFFGSLGSVLHLFQPRFEITVLITETFLSESKKEILDQFVSEGIVKSYYLIYDGKTEVRLLRRLRHIENDLKELNFDIYLAGESFLTYTRYLDEVILPKKCLRVIYSGHIAYSLSDCLQYISSNSKINRLIQDFSKRKEISIKSKPIVANRSISRSFKEVGFSSTLFTIYMFISNRLRVKWKICLYFYNRIVVPWFLLGKTYKYREHEQETQLTSGNVDMLLFTDIFEKNVHEILYSNKSIKVDVVRNILEGKCDCHITDNKSRTILSPLSGVVGVNRVPKEVLDNYLKGLEIALEESGAKSIHLRTHPRETGNWPYQLCDYLNENNIPTKVVDSKKPIPDIICDYMGVAGFASVSLKDARACCDYAFVVGFEELSMMRYLNPKIIYGEGDGIEWISSDGTYNKSIFLRKKYHRPIAPSLIEKLKSLFENERPFL